VAKETQFPIKAEIMKAVVVYEHGGIDKLKYDEIPDPEVRANDVLVRVKACALNHLDI